MHGNTHFPIMVGAAKRFEDTGEGLYKTIVLNFIDVLERTQNFASGGSTFGEHWGSGNLGGIASGVEGWGQDSQVRMCTRPFAFQEPVSPHKLISGFVVRLRRRRARHTMLSR